MSERDTEHYSVKQAASLLGASVWTIYRRIKAGELQAFRAAGGRTQRVSAASVHAFMEQHGIPRLSTGRIPVLIVDDDADVCALLYDVLRRDGRFSIQVAMSGFEAGALLEAHRPALVLLDIQLGDMDGRQLIGHITARAEHRHVKVVAISGYLDHSHLPELERVGFDAFMSKPLQVDELVDQIDAVLARPIPRHAEQAEELVS